MPFVRIEFSDSFELDHAAVRAVADGVHEAMVTAIDVPAGDRFQILTIHPKGNMVWDRTYLNVRRSDRAVFVHITLSAGRDDAKKRALYARIVAEIAARTDVRPEDVLVVLSENTRVDWSFGGGIAQYVPG